MDKKLYDNLNNFTDIYSLLEFINETESGVKQVSDVDLLDNTKDLENDLLTEAKKLSDLKADLLKNTKDNSSLENDAELNLLKSL